MMFSELTTNVLINIDGGANVAEAVGGTILIASGIIECATGAGAVAGGVSIFTGIMTVADGMDW